MGNVTAKSFGRSVTSYDGVVAEVLHLAALEGLFGRPESEILHFQRGTSIHLLYGGYRFSEDLDFAGERLTWTSAKQLVTVARSHIQKLVTQILGPGEHVWKYPQTPQQRKVYTVWYTFRPRDRQQAYRLKMEFAHYPIYQPRSLPIRSEFDLMQRRMLVTGLSSQELLAEKIAAVFGGRYVKGRDLFDLWYLTEILQTDPDPDLVKRKVQSNGAGGDFLCSPETRTVLRIPNSR